MLLSALGASIILRNPTGFGRETVRPLLGGFINGPPAGDFSISATPNFLALGQSSQITSTILLNAGSGFTASVSLTATVTPSGLSVSFSPGSVNLASGCSCVSTATISTSTTTGLYNVTVTGTSGTDSHSITLQVAVTPVTFTINDNENFTGVNVKTTGSVSLDTPASALTVSGSITVVAKNATTGTSLFSQTYTITKQPLNYPYEQAGWQAIFILNIAVSPYPLGFHIEPQLDGPSSTAPGGPGVYNFVYRNADVNGDGFVTELDTSAVAGAFNCRIGMQCYNPRYDLNADGTIDLTDVTVDDFFFGHPNFGVASYTVAANPASLSVIRGGSSSTTITLTSIFGYSGTVNLVATVSPSGPTTSLSPSSVALTSGSAGNSTLTVSATSSTSVGIYNVNVNATSGTRTFTIPVALSIVDFSMSANPAVFTVHNGSTNNSTISVASINGFSGTVTFTATPTPSGPTISVSPSSITVSGCGGSTTLSFRARATTGLYNVTVTATSKSVSHSIIVQAISTPTTFTINDNENFTGVNVKTNGTLSVDSPSSSLTVSGSLTVVATNATTHASLFSKTYTVTRYGYSRPYNGGFQLVLVLNVGVSPYKLGSDITLNISGPSSSAPGSPTASVEITRNPDIDANGLVDLNDFNLVEGAFNCSTGQSCYNAAYDLDADGTINITDIGIADYFYGATNFQ